MVIQIPKPVFYGSFLGSACAGALLLKDYLTNSKDKVKEELPSAEGKVIIITGANSGIGRQTALQFAKLKGKVIMACRDIEKCEKAREEIVLQTLNKHVYCRLCDLASQKSIRKFAERFKNENQRLDILINNAAVMRCPYSKTEEGIELQLGVNHMGHFLLTNLLLDRLKESAPSRIITLSGMVHNAGEINKEDLNSEKNYDEGAAYSQSKLAVVLFTKELARRLRGTNVTVNTVDPGLVEDTELTRHINFYNSFWAVFIKPLLWLVRKSPQQAADHLVYVSLSPSLQKESGKLFRDYKEGDISRFAENQNLAKWMWLTSEKWTNISQTSSTRTTSSFSNDKN